MMRTPASNWISDLRREIASLLKDPCAEFALGIIVLVLGWRMTGTIANFLLVVAWGILSVSFFRIRLVAVQNVTARVSWTTAFAIVCGLLLYYFLWSPVQTPRWTTENIEGTTFTHSEIKKAFPFGYLVISLRDGVWTYEPPPGAQLEWQITKNDLDVKPDFTNGKATWKMDLRMRLDRVGKPKVIANSNLLIFTTPLRVNEAYSVPFIQVQEEPCPFVGTLSDDQRSSVFVLGFRIPAGGDEKSIQIRPPSS